ncbi:MAG: Lrp/AsnC family transcriptional regulator [Pseudomonadota bacterium]
MDTFDRKILAKLQSDGAASNQELADVAGLSASQCSRRRAQLERDGVIEGYRARLDPEALGLDVTVFISITLERHSRRTSESFHAFLERLDEVQEAHAMTGDADYLVKVTVPTLHALSDFVNETLLANEAVNQVRSNIVLKTVKRDGGLPIKPSAVV